MTADRQRCRKRVFGSRIPMGGQLCGNWAKPGTEFCGVHTVKDPKELEGRPATAEPVATSSQRTTYYATLEWDGDTGPVVQVPYQTRLGVITKASAALDSDANLDDARVILQGVILKGDGTLGLQTWDAKWAGANVLPSEHLAHLRRLLSYQRGGHLPK